MVSRLDKFDEESKREIEEKEEAEKFAARERLAGANGEDDCDEEQRGDFVELGRMARAVAEID